VRCGVWGKSWQGNLGRTVSTFLDTYLSRFFLSLQFCLRKLWCVFNDFDFFHLCSLSTSVIFMSFPCACLVSFHMYSRPMSWTSWMITLLTMLPHCPVSTFIIIGVYIQMCGLEKIVIILMQYVPFPDCFPLLCVWHFWMSTLAVIKTALRRFIWLEVLLQSSYLV
jgi:hypothetical protein